MKKLFLLFALCGILFTLTACDGSGSGDDDDKTVTIDHAALLNTIEGKDFFTSLDLE